MDGSFYTRGLQGDFHRPLFLVTLSQMATIRLKTSSKRNGAIMGIAFFAMAIMQVPMVWAAVSTPFMGGRLLLFLGVGVGFGTWF